MNKKEYITPAMEVLNVETVEMIATSVAMFSDEVDTTSKGAQLAGGRRGSWGNLWED